MKKIYGYPIPNQQIKIIHIQEDVKKQKEKPDIPGYEVIFIHNKFSHTCFMEKKPKDGLVQADLVVRANYGEGEGVKVEIANIVP